MAQWGEPHKSDLTFSVAKTYLALLAGIAFDRGLLTNVHEPVIVKCPGIGFEGERLSRITWHHLLQQTSEWEGTCLGIPEQVDRYRWLAYQTGETDGKKGDERKAFMKDCLSASKQEKQQNKMKTCNVEAEGKKEIARIQAEGEKNAAIIQAEARKRMFEIEAEGKANAMTIEALAVKRANDTINKTLTPTILKLRQIEAFKFLSNSNNSKLIITDGKTPFLSLPEKF